MHVCMYVCTHVWFHICVCTHRGVEESMHSYTHARMYVRTHMLFVVCMYLGMYVCMSVCNLCMYVRTYVYLSVRKYSCKHGMQCIVM